MTNQEILQKAIEKAINNGYEPSFIKYKVSEDWYVEENEDGYIHIEPTGITVNEIIFDIDFAKAFFGEDKIRPDGINWIPEWERRLEQMVLEKNRIQYLSEFL